MAYTRKQKEAILHHLKSERNKIAKRNEEQRKKLADQTYQRVMRRLNGVSVTLWDVKLKDVFQVERSQRLVAKTLVKDVQDMKRKLQLEMKRNGTHTK
ncbi:conserved hypothetical protein [Candida tropicalis MYA-3404]|uniref:Uncharacterized protein n=1 Tax=Candida tropicalis (strain ATCC MYA-3404 / T1) TaxID=294747 RepID=C5M6L3_CANTT|nr:conserved hypothetical protein [Candida tropicalis MYA-3404]EER34633.1 conserved hypothetical protein [Candida tropicalis MYA-3404]KAG4408506.1 hypothetical protein JTP64_001812 [Candida tropicalis]